MFACTFQLPFIEFGCVYIYIYIHIHTHPHTHTHTYIYIYIYIYIYSSEMQTLQESINTYSVAFILNSLITAHI